MLGRAASFKDTVTWVSEELTSEGSGAYSESDGPEKEIRGKITSFSSSEQEMGDTERDMVTARFQTFTHHSIRGGDTIIGPDENEWNVRDFGWLDRGVYKLERQVDEDKAVN